MLLLQRILLLALLITPLASWSEQEQAVQEQVTASTDDSAYRLTVGDALNINVYGEPDTLRRVVVDQYGQINYLLVGTVPAAGRTINELRNELNGLLREHFNHALVNVVPVAFEGRHFTIFGEVNRPGNKPLIGETRLLTALAMAGGFRAGFLRHEDVDLEDLDKAFVSRDGEYVAIDFMALVRDGDMSQNIPLEDGDYIYIPSGLSRAIYVLGEVNTPTTIAYRSDETVLSALTQARGAGPRAGTHAYIIRGALSEPERLAVDLEQLVTGAERDVLLQPGDILYVPPRSLIEAEEILYAGLRTFLGAVMFSAGKALYEAIDPNAKDSAGSSNVFFP